MENQDTRSDVSLGDPASVVHGGSNAQNTKMSGVGANGHSNGSARMRLARDLSSGRYRPGQCLRLQEIAEQYYLDHESVLTAFAEFRTLGMIALSGDGSAVVHPLSLKGM